jgi:tetratricopeptide (TPR) repeat protein
VTEPARGLRRAAPWLALLAVVAGTALGYGPALRGEFHFDDWVSIQANMALRDPSALRLPSVAQLLRPDRALTQLSFALDFRAAGLDPFRYHVVSLLLHLLTVVLAFLFVRGLLRRAGHPRAAPLAVVAAAVFALHPIQTQAVAYAAQRSEVLASLFYILSLILLGEAAARPRSPRGAVAWAGGLLAFLLGMGSKSIAITAPAAFVLAQALVAPAGERGSAAALRRGGRALLLAAPLLALAAWSTALHLDAFRAAPQAGVGFASAAPPASSYLLTQLRVQWLYLRLLAWPDALAVERDFPASRGLDAASALAGAGVVALLALAAWLWARAQRAPSSAAPAAVAGGQIATFGILWWFLVLAPTSSVIPVVDLVMEHRVYLASLGPILAACAGADAALHRLLPGPRAAVAGLALSGAGMLALGVALAERARVWSSEVALWRDTTAKSPGYGRPFINLGLALNAKGDPKGAEEAYRRAWGLVEKPLHVHQAARNFGALLLSTGHPQEALSVLERGLAAAPGHPDLVANRAAALVQLGRNSEAIAEAGRAARAAPDDPLIRNLHGEVLAVTGDWAGALSEFAAAGRVDPGEASYSVNQAVALAALGRPAEACQVLSQAAARAGPKGFSTRMAARAAAIRCPP